MKEYVLIMPIRWHGNQSDNNILLVLKDKPAWQKGRLNLVGGKVEPGEAPVDAAMRELYEEAGLKPMHDTDPDWGGPLLCGKIIGVDCVIYCFNCNVGAKNPLKPREGETETVAWHQFWQIKDDPRLIPNLKVIIPLLFMSSCGWTVVDQKSSLDVLSHEIVVSLEIKKPFQNG